MWCIHTGWNTTQSLKRMKMFPFATTWMDLEGITLSEISQTKKANTVYDITCLWNLNNKTNKHNETEIDSQV